jgi:putative aldouronate transport system substrate-binding protein
MSFKIGITVKAKDPGKILKWANWALTEEGEFYYHFGIEGLNHAIVNGKVSYDGMTPISNKHRYLIDIRGRSREVYEAMPFGDILVNVYDAAINDVQYRDTMMMPGTVYEGFEDYNPSVAALFREKVAKMILGELPMSEWDAYVEEWYTKGGAEVQKRVTAWYKETYNIK